MGTYSSLMNANGDFSNLITTHVKESLKSEEKEEEKETKEEKKTTTSKEPSKAGKIISTEERDIGQVSKKVKNKENLFEFFSNFGNIFLNVNLSQIFFKSEKHFFNVNLLKKFYEVETFFLCEFVTICLIFFPTLETFLMRICLNFFSNSNRMFQK